MTGLCFKSYLLLVLMAFTVQAKADTTALKATLTQRYIEMKVAMRARNEAAIKALLTPDFVSVEIDGTRQNADQIIAELKVHPFDPNRESRTDIASVYQDGNIAYVEQEFHGNTIGVDKLGQVHKTESHATSHDEWVNNDGLWKSRLTQTLSLDFYVDGKHVARQEAKLKK